MKKNPHAVALGRRGGRVTSEAKAIAARKNGSKGGRPKRQVHPAQAAATTAHDAGALLAQQQQQQQQGAQ